MRKGFTLIELLISISIMGILTVIALAVYTGVSANARDTVRKNDLKTLATALEVYYQANNKYILPGTGEESCTRDMANFLDRDNGITKFISDDTIPKDPKTRNDYCYIAGTGGISYRLYAKLENCNSADLQITLDCSVENWSSNWNYTITSDNITKTAAP